MLPASSDRSGVARYEEEVAWREDRSLPLWETTRRSLSETFEVKAWLRDDFCAGLVLDAVTGTEGACRRDLRVGGSAECFGGGCCNSGAGVPRSEPDLTLSSTSPGFSWTWR